MKTLLRVGGEEFCKMHNDYLTWTPLVSHKKSSKHFESICYFFLLHVLYALPSLNMPSLAIALRYANHSIPMFAARKFCISSDMDEYDEDITHSDTGH
jgi:hypothetical protein